MYFRSNKRDLNQKSLRTSKNERFLAFLAKKRHPTCFTENQPENGTFSKPSFSELRRCFPFKFFCWTNGHVDLLKTWFLGRRKVFYGIGGVFYTADVL